MTKLYDQASRAETWLKVLARPKRLTLHSWLIWLARSGCPILAGLIRSQPSHVSWERQILGNDHSFTARWLHGQLCKVASSGHQKSHVAKARAGARQGHGQGRGHELPRTSTDLHGPPRASTDLHGLAPKAIHKLPRSRETRQLDVDGVGHGSPQPSHGVPRLVPCRKDRFRRFLSEEHYDGWL